MPAAALRGGSGLLFSPARNTENNGIICYVELMRTIINLTQHQATPEQIAQGVVDLEPCDRDRLRTLLTFEEIPSKEEIEQRAAAIASLAYWDSDAAMIGGAPYLMPALSTALKNSNVQPVYAFSKRESVDMPQEDGSVRKVAVFKHVGFVEV